jgi:N-acetylated-alpha-linked acidic dipeptidase
VSLLAFWVDDKLILDSFRQPSRGLIKAVQQVQAVNKRLIAFERGFISRDGIKDREWYKHLGVAPGKWLGESVHLFTREDGG